MANAAEKGKTEELRELRTHMASVRVHRVLAREDEIEPAGLPERSGESACRRDGVGTGELGVGDEDAARVDVALRCPCERLAQHVTSPKTHLKNHGIKPTAVTEIHPLRNGSTAVGIHFDRAAFAHEAPSPPGARGRYRRTLSPAAPPTQHPSLTGTKQKCGPQPPHNPRPRRMTDDHATLGGASRNG